MKWEVEAKHVDDGRLDGFSIQKSGDQLPFLEDLSFEQTGIPIVIRRS